MTTSPPAAAPDPRDLPAPPPPSVGGWLKRLIAYCLRHRGALIIAFAAALGGAFISAAVPLVIRHVIDSVVGDRRHAGIGLWVVVLLVAAAVQYGLTFLRRYHAQALSLEVQYDLRRDMFAALSRLDGPAQDTLDTGQVVSRSITDIGLVQGLLGFIPMLSSNVLLFVVSLVVMAVLSPVLTIVALAVAPALWFVASRSRRDLFPANWDAQQEAGDLVGDVEAAVTGVRVVKGFGQEGRELSELEGRSRGLFASRLRVVRLQAKYAPALAAVPALGQVAVLALGGYLALRGHLTLGTFLAFSTYLGQLVGPVRQLTALLTIGQQARAGVERVLDVIDAPLGIHDADDAVALPDGPLGIDFDDVRFGYPGSPRVLDGLSLSIAAGETVALVGGAGTGKSTLLQLVGRFYDVDGGSLRVGGTDVRRARAESLRGATGVVFEDSFLFSDTVANNIAYGRPEASPAEIRAAAVLAEADGFISALPDGYDTVVGERGLTLSGGQRQRLSLARALLLDPRVLLLDDATSAIDPRVEARIVAALRTRPSRPTTVLVAHRRSTLELADRIAVLEDGRIVETGTLAELDAHSSRFARLFSPSAADVTTLVRAAPTAAAKSSRSAMRVASAAAARSAGRGGGPGAGGGGMFGAVPATPELLAKVAALPPATGDPDIPDSLSHAADPNFGLRTLIAPLRRVLTVGLVLVGLDAVAQLIVPALVRNGIDQGVLQREGHVLAMVSLIALFVVAVDWVVSHAGQLVTGRTGERLLYLLRVKTFAHLQRLGLDYYERELGGRIMTRMTTDVDALSNFLQTGLTTTVVSLLTLIGVLVALVLVDGTLSLVLIAMLPLLAASTWWFRVKAIPAYVEARERVSTVNAQLQENVAGIRTTQAYVRSGRNLGTYLVASRRYAVSRLRAQKYIATYFPFVQFLSDAAAAIVLAIGAVRLRDGSLTAGALIAFFLYLDAFFSPVQQLSQVFDGYQQASVGLSRLRDLLRTPTSTPPAEHPEPVTSLSGRIDLRNVHFRYQGAESDAVDGVSLSIAPRETVALVGETGAGKSSVVKLMARFYDPTSGAVVVDGHDLRFLDLDEFRHRLGIVPQESYLSSGTVAEAIAYGRPSATMDEVRDAARAVGADEALTHLTDGYSHEVGERGHNLSAGQRQLVALARAELVDPDILLLDEATAALDLASEAAVTEATERLSRKRTTIVVAHRLTTAARADRIVVMDHGRIVEIGAHQELLDAEGLYAELWRSYADRPLDSDDAELQDTRTA